MKTIFLTLLFAMWAGRVAADDFAIPTAAYVREIFTYQDWNRPEWQDINPDRKDPYGGYLFRFSLKFSPEEEALLFVASERLGEWFAPSCNIYVNQPGGGWRKIGTGKTMNFEKFHVDHAQRTIIHHYPRNQEEGTDYSTMRVGTDGSIEEKRYKYEEMDEAARSRLANMGIQVTPAIEKIPIAAYLRNPEAKWRPFDQSKGPRAQSLDEGDNALLKGNRDLEFGAAKELVKKLPDDFTDPGLPAAGKEVQDIPGHQ